MKAAIYYGPKDLRIEKRESPKPGPWDVIVQVKSTGICGTDPHMYEGVVPFVTPPVILGHESSGIVSEVGESVDSLKVGDKVSIDSNFSCGTCWYCRNNRKNLCNSLKIIGGSIDGTFADYVRVPSEVAYKYTKPISFDETALTEPLACSLHGIERANIRFGDSVVIVGAGPIGLMQIQLAKLRGAAELMAIEIVDERLTMAEKLGAIPLKPDEALDYIHKETNGLGVDLVIESSGSLEGSQNSLKMIKKGGRIVIFGGPPESGRINIKPYDFYFKEFEFVGSFIDPFSFERALKLIENKLIDVKSLISHRFPLEKVEEALELAGSRSKGTIKIIVYN